MVLGADGAADLVGVIRDARRRLPVVVLAEPLSVRRTAWEGALVHLAYVAAGTVSMFVLMPQALAALSRWTGVDVARTCGDDAALVYLPTPGNGAGRAVPDGEIHLDDPTAVDGVPLHARDQWNEPHLFTPEGLRAWGSAAALPDHLLDIPSLLHCGSRGDANFDDIGLVRLLLMSWARHADASSCHSTAGGLCARECDHAGDARCKPRADVTRTSCKRRAACPISRPFPALRERLC
ncbi:hypothetical protein ACU686_12305 [Yinghuangia aomiensis]